MLRRIFVSLGAYGQTLRSIAGEVHDASGAIDSGPAISATNTGTNATRTSVTNDAGEYAFPSLPRGIYGVKAEKTGFKTTVRNQIEIQVQQNARIDFHFEVGQIAGTVEVSACAELVTTETADGGYRHLRTSALSNCRSAEMSWEPSPPLAATISRGRTIHLDCRPPGAFYFPALPRPA